jgi:hypothetical protein
VSAWSSRAVLVGLRRIDRSEQRRRARAPWTMM